MDPLHGRVRARDLSEVQESLLESSTAVSKTGKCAENKTVVHAIGTTEDRLSYGESTFHQTAQAQTSPPPLPLSPVRLGMAHPKDVTRPAAACLQPGEQPGLGHPAHQAAQPKGQTEAAERLRQAVLGLENLNAVERKHELLLDAVLARTKAFHVLDDRTP